MDIAETILFIFYFGVVAYLIFTAGVVYGMNKKQQEKIYEPKL